MEDNPRAPLRELSLVIQQSLNIKQDAKLLGSPPSLLQLEVSAVAIKNNRTRDPPSPCFRCGESHWAKERYFIKRRATVANSSVRRRAMTGISPTKRSEIERREELQVMSSLWHLPKQTSRRSIAFIGKSKSMVPQSRCTSTLGPTSPCESSKTESKSITRSCFHHFIKIKSANNKDIKLGGYLECDFHIDGHKGIEDCYVADTQPYEETLVEDCYVPSYAIQECFEAWMSEKRQWFGTFGHRYEFEKERIKVRKS
ncbi:unnamed protein product [Toxocara canis]|uniref:Uncharacterized protein n=1 Tax=Toxocara canis TaxID=6265 RepID=A0A183V997_TOXCA|nr:unnamed protein product [Toxocara canis]